ncbi:MAG: capsular exopolysaccharide family [Anaerocolumna sp.]|jgi:capsular polysaccharide biosynthesis protein|nr:capsular exopolysaccharide family [Anaerocolumna sp.]
METNMNEEIEINIKELFQVLLRKLWIVAFACAICALTVGILTKLFIKPMYTSTTKLYVINRQNTEKSTTYTDLQTGTQLAKDYKILVTSRPVTEQIICELGLTMTHEDLVSSITVNAPTDTRIIEITIKNQDPYVAKQLADAIGKVSAERMVSVMEMEKANIVEPGSIPVVPIGPNVSKNILIAGIIGTVVSSGIILALYISDDTIKGTDDVEKFLGITTLAAIPYEEDVLNSRRVQAALKKAYKKGYRGGLNNAIY